VGKISKTTTATRPVIWQGKKVSISPTFYILKCFAQLFYNYSLAFWQNSIGAKAGRKMLVKLTKGHDKVVKFLSGQELDCDQDSTGTSLDAKLFQKLF